MVYNNDNPSEHRSNGSSYPGGDPRDQQRGSQGPAPADGEQRELDPEGDFAVVPIAYKWGFAGTKNEQIGIRLRIVEGPRKNRTLLYYGSFHPNSEEYTLKALRALGLLDVVWTKPNDSIEHGQQAIAVVQHSEYNGKKQSKVAWINGADVQMKEEMNENDLKAFAHRMRAVVARMSGSSASSAAKPKDVSRPDPRGPDPRDQQQRLGQQQSRGYDPERDAREAHDRDSRNAPPPTDGDEPWTRGQRR